MKIVVNRCDVDVSPSDTIWTLKCKLHREYLRRPSGGEREGVIPPPDDQTLVLFRPYEELSQCDKTVEFYHIHEGSEVSCVPKSRCPQEMHFRKCVDVFRKVERNALSFKRGITSRVIYSPVQGGITSRMTVCVKHACCHMHEVRVLDLYSGFTAANDAIGDEGAIRIAEGLEKNTSLKELNLRCVFTPPSFFIHC
jgi:hypothetical protein